MKDTGSNFNLAICSGKGGTGKTTIALSLAHVLANSANISKPIKLLDFDVEEPNSHLFVSIKDEKRLSVTTEKPRWNMEKCISCGKCAKKCRYNAIALMKGKPILIDDLCHSCGTCELICPTDAIYFEHEEIGHIRHGSIGPMDFAVGELNIGQALAPKVIAGLKQQFLPDGINIIDGPPGTACPAQKTIENSSACLLIAEPTRFGHHDLQLSLKLCNSLQVPTGILINKSSEDDNIIVDLAKEYNCQIVGKISNKRQYAEAVAAGKILSNEFPEIEEELLRAFSKLLDAANEKSAPQIPERELQHHLILKPEVTQTSDEIPTEITVLSGKGGTGKTTITASFAALSSSRNYSDCDVDAANLNLLLGGRTWKQEEVFAGSEAEISSIKCIACGKCSENCRFGAIYQDKTSGKFVVNPVACEGCGLCIEICPVHAITDYPAKTGDLMVGKKDNSQLVHAELVTGGENSGKLVTSVRNMAQKVSHEFPVDWILSDGPPGIACPTIAAISGTDRVILVTEPGVAAFHDLKRIIKLVRHFGLTAEIVINKADLNSDITAQIYDLTKHKGVKVLGEVPYDETINQALKQGTPVVKFNEGKASKAIQEIWKKVEGEKK